MTHTATNYTPEGKQTYTPTKKEKVGYRKPPKNTQFQKGKSGNPKGRPRGAKNTNTLAQSMFDERISVLEGGAQKWITKKEAMLRRLMQMGLEGNLKALEKAFALQKEIDKENHKYEVISDYIYKRITGGLKRAQTDPDTLAWIQSHFDEQELEDR